MKSMDLYLVFNLLLSLITVISLLHFLRDRIYSKFNIIKLQCYLWLGFNDYSCPTH